MGETKEWKESTWLKDVKIKAVSSKGNAALILTSLSQVDSFHSLVSLIILP